MVFVTSHTSWHLLCYVFVFVPVKRVHSFAQVMFHSSYNKQAKGMVPINRYSSYCYFQTHQYHPSPNAITEEIRKLSAFNSFIRSNTVCLLHNSNENGVTITQDPPARYKQQNLAPKRRNVATSRVSGWVPRKQFKQVPENNHNTMDVKKLDNYLDLQPSTDSQQQSNVSSTLNSKHETGCHKTDIVYHKLPSSPDPITTISGTSTLNKVTSTGQMGLNRSTLNNLNKHSSTGGDSTPLSDGSVNEASSADGSAHFFDSNASKDKENRNYYDLNLLKREVNLVDVIESFQLKGFRRTSMGRAVAVCPFHNDNNPSLQIDGANLRMYKCFSCGAGGDVFNFIKEYSKLPDSHITLGEGGPLTYGQAIEYVRIHVLKLQPSRLSLSNSTVRMTSEELQKLQQHQRRKDRMLAANAAAAAYFAANLREPYAGNVRSYLRYDRGLSVETILAYGMGYAPDCYYDNLKSNLTPKQQLTPMISSEALAKRINSEHYLQIHQPEQRLWGDGSLVNHLRDLGFTPDEIVDSGLGKRIQNDSRMKRLDATTTLNQQHVDRLDQEKRSKHFNDVNVDADVFATEKSQLGHQYNASDYTSLMDRFLNRLMVPILDSTGTKVIAFGGRIIPPPQIEDHNNDLLEIISIPGASSRQSNKDSSQQMQKTQSTKKGSNFVAPKYMNSPQSIIFEKKNVLFGLHLAEIAINQKRYLKNELRVIEKEKKFNQFTASDDDLDCIVLVEGYMDAIALWAVGIRNVVASMGTAITQEQLTLAAKAVGEAKTISNNNSRGAKIILCLDSDDAGFAAVERICKNGILLDTTKRHPGVDIFVATIPTDSNSKDPADFIESILSGGSSRSTSAVASASHLKEIKDSAAFAFQKDVICQSVHWVEWMIQRIIQTYNPNMSTLSNTIPGSLNDIFERIAAFLAVSCPYPTDRIQYVSITATELAKRIAISISNRNKNNDKSPLTSLSSSVEEATVSDAVRIQLESELLDRTAQVARRNAAVVRRTQAVFEATEEDSGRTILADRTMVQKPIFSRSTIEEDVDSNASQPSDIFTRKSETAIGNGFNEPRNFLSVTQKNIRKKRSRARIQRRNEPDVESITPHYSGIFFENKSDRQWLGIAKENEKRTKNDRSLVLGYKPLSDIDRLRAKQRGMDHMSTDAAGLMDKLVYFNSADYNGYQFLTDDANRAGYGIRSVCTKPDSSVVKYGIASLVKQDVESILMETEDSLLRVLIRSKVARTSAKTIVQARNILHEGTQNQDILWSSSAKEWLFQCLVGLKEEINNLPQNAHDLLQFLSLLPHVSPEFFRPVESKILPIDPDVVKIDRYESSLNEIVDLHDNVEIIGTLKLDDTTPTSDDLPKGSKQQGLLNYLFENDNDFDCRILLDTGTPLNDHQSDLVVQELYTTLVWASKALQLQRLSHSVLSNLTHSSIISSELNTKSHKEESDFTNAGQLNTILPSSGNVSMTLLPSSQPMNYGESSVSLYKQDVHLHDGQINKDQLSKLNMIFLESKKHHESLKRVSNHLMDQSINSDRPEGRMSSKILSDLSVQLDEFIATNDFVSSEIAASELDFHYSSNEEPYEIALERMKKEFGDWFDDDYVWSPRDTLSTSVASLQQTFYEYDLVESDESSLEDDLRRIERDWGHMD